MRRIKVALETLGCKLNQAETEALSRRFWEMGYELVEPSQGFDIYILNTCTVTQIADSKSRQRLRWAKRQNPQALLIATGCYAQNSPEELKRLPVDLVVPNSEKSFIPEIVKERMPSFYPPFEGRKSLRTRSFIKIQDGCDNFCSYCIVPYVRGRERSLPPEDIIKEIKKRTEEGYKEIVLTGTNIGSYHWDGIGLYELVKQILSRTNILRLRLSSLKPYEITPKLLSLWQDERLCPHFHLPLQSGSDRVLKEMGRKYSTEDFERAVIMIREAIPLASITTDVIVGFPGEEERDFEETLSFCQRIGFAQIHVFPYSLRVGTKAASFPYKIDEKTKQARARKMLDLARSLALKFRERFLGQTLPVLWEKEERGIWMGLTGNYLRVFTQSKEPLTNQCRPTKLVSLTQNALWGVTE